MGENPPRGAVIDYVITSDAPGPVTLEILDSKGNPVRRWSSEERPRPPDLSRIVVTPDWVTPAEPVSTAAGMHRFVWDLRYALPKELVGGGGFRGGSGPWAPPGRYTVRLTAGGKTFTQPLDVVKDPRLGAGVTDADLAQQLELVRDIQAERVRVALAQRQVTTLRTQIAALKKAGTKLPPAFDSFAKSLDRLAGPPASPEEWFDSDEISPTSLRRLAASLSGLQGAIESADAAPTPDAVAGFAARKKMAEEGLARWRGFLANDLPAVNRALQGSGLADLKID
jgi:hypothetical protein